MAILLALTDFKGGKYDHPDADGQFTKVPYFQACIDLHERPYIHKLLGVTTGNLLITYIQANLNTNADYNKIIAPFAEDGGYWPSYDCHHKTIMESVGLKEYLKAAIFYEYVTDRSMITSQAGVTINKSETANIQYPASSMRFAEKKFNSLLGTIEAIQWYCTKNKTAFPDYNGQRIPVKASNIF